MIRCMTVGVIVYFDDPDDDPKIETVVDDADVVVLLRGK